jgi:hypothetical protein
LSGRTRPSPRVRSVIVQAATNGGKPLHSEFCSCCAVCGQIVEEDDCGYLLSTHPLTNRITIFCWSSARARIDEVRAACQPQHAIEMVAEWIACGTLNLTFADASLPHVSRRKSTLSRRNPGTRVFSQPLGELAINPETVRRLFEGNPGALASMLDCLLEALRRDQTAGRAQIPSAKVLPAKATATHRIAS